MVSGRETDYKTGDAVIQDARRKLEQWKQKE